METTENPPVNPFDRVHQKELHQVWHSAYIKGYNYGAQIESAKLLNQYEEIRKEFLSLLKYLSSHLMKIFGEGEQSKVIGTIINSKLKKYDED